MIVSNKIIIDSAYPSMVYYRKLLVKISKYYSIKSALFVLTHWP